MHAQSSNSRFSGFTLIELLVVVVIMGVLLMLASGMSQRTRNTFTAQQFVKTAVQNARILRRKSMLISRNSGESTKWVYGIGFTISKDNTGQWIIRPVKAMQSSPGSSNFYKTYPANDLSLGGGFIALEDLEDATIQKLPAYMDLQIKDNSIDPDSPTDPSCTQTLTVIYESINGNLHTYCGDGSMHLPTNSTIKDIDIIITILYGSPTVDTYGFYLNLKGNGEINAVKNQEN